MVIFHLERFTLLIPIYGSHKGDKLKALKNLLFEELKGLNVEISNIDIIRYGYPEITLEGMDLEAARNYLCWLYESPRSFYDLKEGEVRKGWLKSVGKVGFGLFVDIGVVDPYTETLIPLFKVREQLVNGEKVSTKNIVNLYGFIDYFPLQLKILKIDQGVKQIEAELSEGQINLFKKWIQDRLDRIVVTDITRQRVRKAVIKSGHLKDIVAIERLGLLENVVVCKYGTNAPGLIKDIGPFIREAKLSAFRPKKIRAFKKKNKGEIKILLQ